ncbi:MAG: hypothetical protein KDG50_05925 [Chromatiales bacterium]|nr:hypothetical protein [Chromatiales bacterium]
MTESQGSIVGAELVIGPGCPHCEALLRELTEFVRQGELARVLVLNAGLEPEAARERGVRNVPWLKLGPFVLTGARSATELSRWIHHARNPGSCVARIEHALEHGRVDDATAECADAEGQAALLQLLADPDVPLNSRVGLGAVVETLAEDGRLAALAEGLAEITRAEATSLRIDACHYLGLAGGAAARKALERCLNDASEEVREVAAEALRQA